MNYAELQTEVLSFLHRTDQSANCPGWIARAEAYLFRELHVKELQVSVDGTTTGEYATLPADFGSASRVSVTYSGAARTLDYISLATSSTTATSAPLYYSLENNKLRIWGASDGQAYTLYYIPKIDNLSDTVTTNWLLDNAQDLYTYAAALEGAKFLRNREDVDRIEAAIPAMLDSVKRFSERRGQPATGSMQIKPRR